MKNIKILLYKEEQNSKLIYYIYSTETKQVKMYTQSEIDNMIINGEYIRCLDDSNRKNGTLAVVYKSDPKRYIVVNHKGVHLFRTLRELNYNKNIYFNVNITKEEIRSLDGDIIKADAYTKNLTYVNMYKLNSKTEFTIHKDTNTVDLDKCCIDELEYFRSPNFVTTLKSYSFENKSINTLIIGDPLKKIEKFAFQNLYIGILIIDKHTVDIESLAFKDCKIKTLRIQTNMDEIQSDIFKEANIEILDLTYAKVKSIENKLIQSLNGLCTIILPIAMKRINIDILPPNINSIVTTCKKLDIQCKDKDKLEKLKEKLNSIPSRVKELIINGI